MSSVGQAVGMVVGGVIGFFAGGNVMLGASIGGAIGGYIDPPKGPKIEGPRLNDLAVQTSTYGAQIPVIKGSVATFGNIFWVENNALKETKKTEEQGGKGGGGQETTTYSYSATFALGLCLGPVDGIRRIWCSGKLLFDSGDSSLSAVMSNNFVGVAVDGLLTTTLKAIPETTGNGAIRFYNGGPLQEPDPRMQAALGVANTPAYRGLAYIVFDDFQLADFGNSLMGAQFKVEVIESASTDQYAIRTRIQEGLFPDFEDDFGDVQSSTAGPYNPTITNGIMSFDKEQTRFNVTLEGTIISRVATGGVAPGVVGDTGERFFIGTTSGGHGVYYNKTGPNYCGYLVVGGVAEFAGYFSPGWELQGACVGADGNLYLQQYKSGSSCLEKYDGNDLSLIWTHNNTLATAQNSNTYPALTGTGQALAVNEGNLFWHLSVNAGVLEFDVFSIGADGALTFVHRFTSEGGSGWAADSVCPSATGMICSIAHSHGGFYVFDATPILVPELVELSDIVSSLCLGSNLLTAGDIDVTALTQEVRGYRITETSAIRAAIEPLRACWPFDAVQSGYKIKFVPRGGSSIATVSENDLGAVADKDKSGVRISVAREMDTQLPRRVETKFIDAAREYDVGTGPGTERLNTDAVNILQIDLPVVLVADEAAGIEQTLLYLYWIERSDLSFVLPPTYLNIEPSDIITINSTDATYVVRITSIQYLPDGRLECAAKYNRSPIYTPVAVGETGAVLGQSLSFNGPTQLALLDVPCIDSTIMDQPGLLAATTGVYSGWPGASLLRSDDNGQTWTNVQGFVAPGAIMGYATVAIGAGATHVVDTASKLNVRLLSGSLETVTEAQMFNGSNHFAYGSHGRWEIIAAKTVTAETDGTYTLQNLMRGRFGTEQYMAAHGVTDSLVLLDSARVRFVGMNINSVNITRDWRAVTRGAMLNSATDTPLAYAGVNLECLPPVHVKGSKSASNNWSIAWTRRTRTVVEPFSGVAAPLAESSESYDLEIYSNSDRTTLLRTFSALTSAAASYTSAQQITDFGVVQRALYVRVYQNSATLGRGYPCDAVVGSAGSLAIKSLLHLDENSEGAGRVLGLHCDGTNNSTIFTDVHGKTVTANGNAKISTAQYPSLTGKSSSASFDGTTDYLSVPNSTDFDFSTLDFTIRFLIRTSSTTVTIMGKRAGVGYGPFVLGINGTGKLQVRLATSNGAFAVDISSTDSINTGSWVDVEVTRASGTVRMFVAGNVQSSTASLSSALYVVTDPIYLGANSDGTACLNGYLSEIEVYKGVALHTASFTPSSNPFTDFPESITDKAGNTVTVVGAALIVANAGSFGGRCLQANQGSGYVYTSAVDLTADKWTIDLWITPDALPSSGKHMGVFDYASGPDGDGGFSVGVYSDGLIRVFFSYYWYMNAIYATAGVRTHMFVMRDGASFYTGSGGSTSSSNSSPIANSTFVGNKILRIGYANITAAETKAIKIDEFRCYSGDARYTTAPNSTYPIPSFPFPDP